MCTCVAPLSNRSGTEAVNEDIPAHEESLSPNGMPNFNSSRAEEATAGDALEPRNELLTPAQTSLPADKPLSLVAQVESLLFVAETPAELKHLSTVLHVSEDEIQEALHALADRYVATGGGLRVQERNGRYSLVTVPAAAQAIEDFLNLDLNSRLSSAALETLAIIAYRQPVTRAQIEAIRGVECGGVLRTLLQRELIAEAGRLETVGRPILYEVADLFMNHFGLTQLDELPPLETADADMLWAATQLSPEDEDDKSAAAKLS